MYEEQKFNPETTNSNQEEHQSFVLENTGPSLKERVENAHPEPETEKSKEQYEIPTEEIILGWHEKYKSARKARREEKSNYRISLKRINDVWRKAGLINAKESKIEETINNSSNDSNNSNNDNPESDKLLRKSLYNNRYWVMGAVIISYKPKEE